MAKHTLREILGIFATHVGHTHEAAVQATYDHGYEQGKVDAKEETAAPAETEKSDAETDQAPEGQDAPPAETDAPKDEPPPPAA